MFNNAQEFTAIIKKKKKKTLEVNSGIYPIQYLAATNLQAKQTTSKTPAHCIKKKKKKVVKKNNKTKPVLTTLPFLGKFNKTRTNPETIIGYFLSFMLSLSL